MGNTRNKLKIAAIATLIGGLVTIPGIGATAAELNPPAVIDVNADGLSADEIALYKTDVPKVVTVNERGELTSVTEGLPMQTFAVTPNNCSGDRACWYGLGPSLIYGFNGTGASGEWSNRVTFESKNYEARLCWKNGPGVLNPEYCLPYDERLRKNTSIDFGGAVVGTRVMLTR